MRQVEDQRADIERMQIENEEEKAVLESGLDETLAELASLQHGQTEQSSTLQARIDSMTSAHKRKMQQILGKDVVLVHAFLSASNSYRFCSVTIEC